MLSNPYCKNCGRTVYDDPQGEIDDDADITVDVVEWSDRSGHVSGNPEAGAYDWDLELADIGHVVKLRCARCYTDFEPDQEREFATYLDIELFDAVFTPKGDPAT